MVSDFLWLTVWVGSEVLMTRVPSPSSRLSGKLLGRFSAGSRPVVEKILSIIFQKLLYYSYNSYLGRAKRIWYLSHMRAAKVQASLRIRAVSPEPPLLAHTSSESRGTFRQKARSLAPLNGWACAVKICHDGMLEDTNSLDGAHFKVRH